MRERQVSEDWVTRTRSLSIENIEEKPARPLGPVVEMVFDENMVRYGLPFVA